jgi:hypothetical protein
MSAGYSLSLQEYLRSRQKEQEELQKLYREAERQLPDVDKALEAMMKQKLLEVTKSSWESLAELDQRYKKDITDSSTEMMEICKGASEQQTKDGN